MRVKFSAYLREHTNCPETDLPTVPTVGDLVRLLGERYGPGLGGKLLTPQGELGEEIVILVNNRHVVHMGGIDAPLQDDDVVQLFPLVTGG
jgi:molybdopterin synthase sulfur carrier subunit